MHYMYNAYICIGATELRKGNLNQSIRQVWSLLQLDLLQVEEKPYTFPEVSILKHRKASLKIRYVYGRFKDTC